MRYISVIAVRAWIFHKAENVPFRVILPILPNNLMIEIKSSFTTISFSNNKWYSISSSDILESYLKDLRHI